MKHPVAPNHAHKLWQGQARWRARRRFGRAAQQQPLVGMQVPVSVVINGLQFRVDRRQVNTRTALRGDAHPALPIAVSVQHCAVLVGQLAGAAVFAFHGNAQAPLRFEFNSARKLLKIEIDEGAEKIILRR